MLPAQICDDGNVPAKAPWVCARGFTEAEWNDASTSWKTATDYNLEADELNVDVSRSKKRTIL